MCLALGGNLAHQNITGLYLRPDAYNADSIYYVTDEQFGYVAYLAGMMARDKPAACFYMGAFFAESLILAETGNADPITKKIYESWSKFRAQSVAVAPYSTLGYMQSRNA